MVILLCSCASMKLERAPSTEFTKASGVIVAMLRAWLRLQSLPAGHDQAVVVHVSLRSCFAWLGHGELGVPMHWSQCSLPARRSRQRLQSVACDLHRLHGGGVQDRRHHRRLDLLVMQVEGERLDLHHVPASLVEWTLAGEVQVLRMGLHGDRPDPWPSLFLSACVDRSRPVSVDVCQL